MKIILRNSTYLLVEYIFYIASVSFLLFSFQKNSLFLNVSGWFRDAIPVVLGIKYFAMPSDYTVNYFLKETFFAECQSTNISDLNQAIQKVKKLPKSSFQQKQDVLGNDDKGIIDYVRLAFLFSDNAANILYLYIILIIISTHINFIVFNNKPCVLLLQNCLLISFGVISPLIAAHPEIQSFISPRYLPIGAIFPCLFFIFNDSIIKKPLVFAGTLQGTLLVFLYHVRLTILSFVCIILLLQLLNIIFNYKANFVYLAAILILLAAKSFFFWSTISPQYFQKPNTPKRVFWHNIVSGLACNQFYQTNFKLKIDDVSIIMATGEYLKKEGRNEYWDKIGGNSDGFSKIWWARYDYEAKNLLLYFLKNNLFQVCRAFFLDKTRILVSETYWVLNPYEKYPNKMLLHPNHVQSMENVALQLQKKPIIIFNHFIISFTLLRLLVIKVFRKYYGSSLSDFRAIGILLLLSIISPFVGYPLLHCIGETLVVFIGIFYFFVNRFLFFLLAKKMRK